MSAEHDKEELFHSSKYYLYRKKLITKVRAATQGDEIEVCRNRGQGLTLEFDSLKCYDFNKHTCLMIMFHLYQNTDFPQILLLFR